MEAVCFIYDGGIFLNYPIIPVRLLTTHQVSMWPEVVENKDLDRDYVWSGSRNGAGSRGVEVKREKADSLRE